MWSKYLLPVLSVIGLVLGIVAVIISRQTPPTPPIPFAPPSPPFDYFIAGQGLVEAKSQDISIGTPRTDVVEKVYVEAGDYIAKGAPLFKLDTRELNARLKEAETALAVAEAEYQKQIDLPRPEDVLPYQARVKQAESNFINHWKQYELVDKIENPKAVSRDEYNRRKYAALTAKYELQEAEDELDLLIAGAWVRDLEISRKRVKEARARVESVAVEIEISTIRAPIDGIVFRMNIRNGEIATAAEQIEPLLLVGSVDPLHIRVDIDEEDAWRVIRGAPGVAYVRGNSSLHVPLEFVRLEPYLVPKSSLTGDTTEQVDTRVLQLIYEFNAEELPVFPGMLMDVYLESKPSGVNTKEPAQ